MSLQTADAHLGQQALRELGPPDLRLRLASTCFPVLKASVDWSNGIERSIASHQNAAARCLGASELPATVAVGTAPLPFHLSFPFHLLLVS